MSELEPWIVGVQVILMAITGILALVPPFRKMESERRRESANAAGVLTESALDIAARWESAHAKLEARVLKLEAELRSFRRGVRILIDQVRRAGLDPEWEPAELEDLE